MRILKLMGKINITGGVIMKDTVLKLQIESMEQQLKMLKTKIVKPKPHKKLSELYGIFKGKMDLSLEEITEHKYTVKGNP